jgi:hypothetical protein
MLIVFVLDFDETWIYSTDFREILTHYISANSSQRDPSCSMPTDRQIKQIHRETDRQTVAQTDIHDEAKSSSLQFCERNSEGKRQARK